MVVRAKVANKRRRKAVGKSVPQYPISHWSHSSLMAFLRNPLAWHKRYVEKVYDTPSTPSGIIGRAGHVALQHYYGGIAKAGAIELGLQHLRGFADFEINFGTAMTPRAKQEKRTHMEQDYLRAVHFYLERPPRHDVVGVEVMATAEVEGLPLPLKAISDLVVVSRGDRRALDIVDHKFVDSFSKDREDKTLFILQAIFNYYTVREKFGKPVRRFIVYECRKRQNKDGSSQMRRYAIDFRKNKRHFEVFHRLINDASAEIARERVYLPNPSDMFEGENSFEIYRLGL
ncbi:MAG: PD-(D/E)XK nuclease family protein [Patescibacteria group bacterium]|nr:PD-(D/E)XK nuclease family protein [Patescibacteria group bacterium]